MKIKNVLLKIPIIIRNFLFQEIREELKNEMKIIKNDIREIKKDNKKIHNELKDNRLDTQRIAICSEEIPLSERITIGKDYIKNGGNGAVKVKVHVLEETYEKQLKEECKNV